MRDLITTIAGAAVILAATMQYALDAEANPEQLAGMIAAGLGLIFAKGGPVLPSRRE